VKNHNFIIIVLFNTFYFFSSFVERSRYKTTHRNPALAVKNTGFRESFLFYKQYNPSLYKGCGGTDTVVRAKWWPRPMCISLKRIACPDTDSCKVGSRSCTIVVVVVVVVIVVMCVCVCARAYV